MASTIFVPASPGVQYIRKTADETVNNSTTVQNDNDLKITVAASEIWAIYLFILHNSSAVADFKIGFSDPGGGATLRWAAVSGSTPVALNAIASTENIAGAGADRKVDYAGVYVGGTAAGTLNFQWAQQTAEVSDTKVLANSYILAFKLA